MGILGDIWAIRNFFIAVLTPVLLLPLVLITKSEETKCAYIVLLTAIFWITEALPIAVTSLLPVVLFPVIGLMSASETSSAYISDTSMLFIGGLLLAAATEHWNLHKRIALKVLLLVGCHPLWLLLGVLLPTWFLSMWINNTATAAMMIPIANAVMVQFRDARSSDKDHDTGGYDNKAIEMSDSVEIKRSEYQEIDGSFGDTEDDSLAEKDLMYDPEYIRLCKALSLAVAYASNVGGITTLTGSFPNIIMKGQTDLLFQRFGGISPVTFASSFLYGLPISLLVFLFLWMWLYMFFIRCRYDRGGLYKGEETSNKIQTMLKKEYDAMGPVNFGQASVAGHLVVLAVLWITRDLGGNGGWGYIFPSGMVTDSTPSILISCSLFIFPSEIPRVFCCNKVRKYVMKPLLPWSIAEKTVPWGVMILLGGGFAIVKGSEETGLSSWLADQLIVFSEFEPWVMNMILCFIMAAATEVTSNTAISTLMMPIVTQLAFRLGVNPLYFMIPTAIATSFAFMLPVATPPNAIVFSYGYVRVMDMMLAGFLMNIFAVLILVIGTETIGQAIYNFHTVPSIFNVSTTMAPSSSVSTLYGT